MPPLLEKLQPRCELEPMLEDPCVSAPGFAFAAYDFVTVFGGTTDGASAVGTCAIIAIGAKSRIGCKGASEQRPVVSTPP